MDINKQSININPNSITNPQERQTLNTVKEIVNHTNEEIDYYKKTDETYQDKAPGLGKVLHKSKSRGYRDKVTLEYDPDSGKATNFNKETKYGHWTERHTSKEKLNYRLEEKDGEKVEVYERKTYEVGKREVINRTETVKVNPDGTMEYSVKNSPGSKISNYLAKHPNLRSILYAAGGAAVLGGLGLVAAPAVGIATGTIGAATGISEADKKPVLNNNSKTDEALGSLSDTAKYLSHATTGAIVAGTLAAVSTGAVLPAVILGSVVGICGALLPF